MLHKAIVGYEDYLISDTGHVYSLKTEKYLKSCKYKDGYYIVSLSKNKKHKSVLVHRLVAQAFIPNPSNKPTVDHINRDKTDNRVENLRWASRHEQQVNRDFTSYREKRGIRIIEIVDNKEVEYLSLNVVPDINIKALLYHISKGETDFYAKGRHFKLPQQK